MSGLRNRFGIDLATRMPLEEGIRWAGENGFRFLNVGLDIPQNAPATMDAVCVRAARETVDRLGIDLGLHTLSAVNTAETSPFVSEAVDAYLRSYVDMAKTLGIGRIIVHAGYHFTKDFERRKLAARDRLAWLADYAAAAGTRLLLENMNKEPPDAEVRYLGYDIAECRFIFDSIDSPGLGWAYTVNHAHMLPEGIAGFTASFDLGRCGEVRLADNRGDKEEHLPPGEGTIDFDALFAAIEGAGYGGHYMIAYGKAPDMAKGRDWFVERWSRL